MMEIPVRLVRFVQLHRTFFCIAAETAETVCAEKAPFVQIFVISVILCYINVNSSKKE